MQLDQKGSTVQYLSELYLSIIIMIIKDCFCSSYFKVKKQILLGLIFVNFLDRIMFSLRYLNVVTPFLWKDSVNNRELLLIEAMFLRMSQNPGSAFFYLTQGYYEHPAIEDPWPVPLAVISHHHQVITGFTFPPIWPFYYKSLAFFLSEESRNFSSFLSSSQVPFSFFI